MNKYKFTVWFLFFSLFCFSQTPGYYNNAYNKNGEELKSALHNIIKGHIDFSYGGAKWAGMYSQEDPANSNNFIVFYSGKSVPKDDWDGNLFNREHVWAKSHGWFANIRPMDGDYHNLHVADAYINQRRSYFDFDYSRENGVEINETGCYVDTENHTFEPSDEDKGQVARTLFYMAVRYEGDNGEMDLELNDSINVIDYDATYYKGIHGKLLTLLKWNREFPPTDFERRRNDRIEEYQKNRNPFIDHPEYADMIWSDSAVSSVVISNVSVSPAIAKSGKEITISADIQGADNVSLYWGSSYGSLSNIVNGNTVDCRISFIPSGIYPGKRVYMKLVAKKGEKESVEFMNIQLDPGKNITPIKDVQGDGDVSPYGGRTVTIAGVVTCNLESAYTVQSTGVGKRGAIYVYCINCQQRGYIGDSIIVTGKISEYNGLTELNATQSYVYGPVAPIEPRTIDFASVGEDYESMLIRLKNVLFVSDYEDFPADDMNPYPSDFVSISNGVNYYNFYARYTSRFANTPVPMGYVNLNSIVMESNGKYALAANDTSWYDLNIVDNEPPEIINISQSLYSGGSYAVLDISFSEYINELCTDKSNFHLNNNAEILRTLWDKNAGNKIRLYVKNFEEKQYTLTLDTLSDLKNNDTINYSYDFNGTVSTQLQETGSDEFSVYPNPAGKYFSVSESVGRLAILDLNGNRLISAEKLFKGDVVDVSRLCSGIYIIRCNDKSYKLIKR